MLTARSDVVPCRPALRQQLDSVRDSLGSGPAAGAGPAPRHIAGDHDRQYVLHDADAEERAAAAEAAAAAGDAARRVLAPLDHPLPPFSSVQRASCACFACFACSAPSLKSAISSRTSRLIRSH